MHEFSYRHFLALKYVSNDKNKLFAQFYFYSGFINKKALYVFVSQDRSLRKLTEWKVQDARKIF